MGLWRSREGSVGGCSEVGRVLSDPPRRAKVPARACRKALRRKDMAPPIALRWLMKPHPIQLHIGDDLQRRRLTVFFRALLVLPHLVWIVLWGIAALVVALANWVITLVQGKSPDALHGFLARYVRYVTHVYAYLFLAANPYPRPDGRPGYPVDVEIAPPARQNRWSVAFRGVLGLPALVPGGQLGST